MVKTITSGLNKTPEEAFEMCKGGVLVSGHLYAPDQVILHFALPGPEEKVLDLVFNSRSNLLKQPTVARGLTTLGLGDHHQGVRAMLPDLLESRGDNQRLDLL